MATRPYPNSPSPSGIVAGVTATRLELHPHEFTDPEGPTDAETFPVGSKIAICSRDLHTLRGNATVTGVDARGFNCVPPPGVQLGDVALFQDEE